jgi:phage baseplate assembly protein V
MSNPLLTRLANLVARAVLNRVNDTKMMQTVQLTALEGETRADVERVQEYGFTSVPLAGAEAVAVFPGGFREQGLVIATDDRRYRLTGLTAGEVAIYTDQGDKVVIERGGTIRVTASAKVVIATPVVELAGNTRAVAKGEDLNTAIATLATAIGAAVGTIAVAAPVGGGAAAAAITTAVGAFTSSAAAALSTKVKLS